MNAFLLVLLGCHLSTQSDLVVCVHLLCHFSLYFMGGFRTIERKSTMDTNCYFFHFIFHVLQRCICYVSARSVRAAVVCNRWYRTSSGPFLVFTIKLLEKHKIVEEHLCPSTQFYALPQVNVTFFFPVYFFSSQQAPDLLHCEFSFCNISEFVFGFVGMCVRANVIVCCVCFP